MRAKAFENLVKRYSMVIDSEMSLQDKIKILENLSVKGRILVSRENDSSVLKELLNE